MGERTAREITIDSNGGPEAMRIRERILEAPGPGMLLLRQTAVGLNFVDIYFRRGEKPVATFPFVNGFEGVGVVEETGSGTMFKPGDRIGYVLEGGAYASRRLLDARRAILLPDWLEDEQAAGVLLKGLTADYLVHAILEVGPSDIVIVHAAAGGVGTLLCQWAGHYGARVFGTVGSEQKRKYALDVGCEAAFVRSSEDWLARFTDATGGAGATIVYDGVGRDTFYQSHAALRVQGKLIAFGSASGNPEPLDIALLNEKSVTVSNPGIQHFIGTRAELDRAAGRLFDAIERGVLEMPRVTRFRLEDAEAAHRALESRATTGAVVLSP